MTTKQLAGTSILIADDQMDVVRTLCDTLRKAGAGLHFVPDGQSALEHVAANPVDLIIVDLKMPPNEWGGLWLLERLQQQRQTIPSIVLSGEDWGVREAFRLGAADYIAKTEVAQDLLARCTEKLDECLAQGLDRAAKELPAPLAHRFARYQSASDPDKKLSEGLHALEEIFRFGAIIGLSSMSPTPLRGVARQPLSSPSMGTWLDLCVALANHPHANTVFTRYWSWIAPKRSGRDPIRDLVRFRNSVAHGRPADPSAAAPLDPLLRRFAHRALGLWRAELAVPQTMTYDGESFEAAYVSLTGAGPHKLGTVRTPGPLTTGHPVLLTAADQPLPLTPWLIASQHEATGAIRCLQFDGTIHRPGDDDSVALRYAPVDGEPEKKSSTGPGAGNWGDLARWSSDGDEHASDSTRPPDDNPAGEAATSRMPQVQ